MSSVSHGSQTGKPRRIFVLGATGSIGRSTMEILRTLRFDVVGLTAHRNAAELFELAKEFSALAVALTARSDDDAASGVSCALLTGADAAAELVRSHAERGDLVVNAIVGAAGLAPTLAAIERGCDVALANKESLVAAGHLVMSRAEAAGVRIIPVDSEHAAIALCLRGVESDEVSRVVLTASGGPFLDWPIERMDAATVQEALCHPNWEMGPKITIDCASLMNKAFELIEAHWLFGLRADQIDAIVHPQSIVHGLVELCDGAVIAQLAPADMKIPIRQAITGGCGEGGAPRLDLAALGTLEFLAVDDRRFPAVRLSRQVMEAGGTAGAIFNGANEAAVEAFRAGAIRFGGISRLVREALDHLSVQSAKEPEDVFAADEAARSFVRGRVERSAATIRT